MWSCFFLIVCICCWLGTLPQASTATAAAPVGSRRDQTRLGHAGQKGLGSESQESVLWLFFHTAPVAWSFVGVVRGLVTWVAGWSLNLSEHIMWTKGELTFSSYIICLFFVGLSFSVSLGNCNSSYKQLRQR